METGSPGRSGAAGRHPAPPPPLRMPAGAHWPPLRNVYLPANQAWFVVPVMQAYDARIRPPAVMNTAPVAGERYGGAPRGRPPVTALGAGRPSPPRLPPPPGPATTATSTAATTASYSRARARARPRPRPRAAAQPSAFAGVSGVRAAAPSPQPPLAAAAPQPRQQRRPLVYGAGGFYGYGDPALDDPLDEEVAWYFYGQFVPLTWYSYRDR